MAKTGMAFLGRMLAMGIHERLVLNFRNGCEACLVANADGVLDSAISKFEGILGVAGRFLSCPSRLVSADVSASVVALLRGRDLCCRGRTGCNGAAAWCWWVGWGLRAGEGSCFAANACLAWVGARRGGGGDDEAATAVVCEVSTTTFSNKDNDFCSARTSEMCSLGVSCIVTSDVGEDGAARVACAPAFVVRLTRDENMVDRSFFVVYCVFTKKMGLPASVLLTKPRRNEILVKALRLPRAASCSPVSPLHPPPICKIQAATITMDILRRCPTSPSTSASRSLPAGRQCSPKMEHPTLRWTR